MACESIAFRRLAPRLVGHRLDVSDVVRFVGSTVCFRRTDLAKERGSGAKDNEASDGCHGERTKLAHGADNANRTAGVVGVS